MTQTNRLNGAAGAGGVGRVGVSGGLSVLARTKAGGIENQVLWDRLRAFELDRPGDARPFSARLAQEQGWTREFTLRAINEYRKFVYLMATAPFAVTPSKVVDEVWHLHLMHTRSYWHELCGDVIGRELHHDPSRGGAAERAKFEHWYERTLRRYRESFGEPPADVWPAGGTVAARAGASAVQHESDNRQDHSNHRAGWVVIGLLLGGSALLLYAMTTGGCMLKRGEHMPQLSESSVIIGVVIAGTILLAIFSLIGTMLKRSKRRGYNAGLNRHPGTRGRHGSTTDHQHHNPGGAEFLLMQNMLNSSSGSGGDDRHHDPHHHGGHDHHDGGGSHDGGSDGGGDSGGGGGGGDSGGGGDGGGSGCGGGCGGGGD
ncbi:MAG: hypothetical protein IBJ18_03625 [Phycisphaerales bacterium]|nr:hypothetical protein [Phycisphaerales bacterium]